MTKSLKQRINSVYSITNIILLTLQSFMPGFFALMPSNAYASEVMPMIGEVDLEFSQDRNEFDLTVLSSVNIDYELTYTYEASDSATKRENVRGIKGIAISTDSAAEASIYAGTCSGSDCVADDPISGNLSLPRTGYNSDFVIVDENLWMVRENKATVPTVDLGTIYSAPQNNEVQVIFTKLPENPGSLTIEEIELTEETSREIRAYSRVAYDITSNMKDGTFEYELKLPLPEGADEKAGMVYAESVEELRTATAVTTDVVEGRVVRATGLNHFTIFVVADPTGATNGTSCTVASITGTCYDTLQAAVDAAVSGDTIELASDITLGHRVDINTTLTLDGNGNTIFASFTKTSNSNNAALGIFADDVVIQDLILDGTGGLDWPDQLHGINIYVAEDILLDNITAMNFGGSGVVVNGSTVTVNNITTARNGWHGINVDLGGGVAGPAVLTVNGTSTQFDALHIYVDDSTEAVSIVDTNSQYSSADNVLKTDDRLYSLIDDTAPTVENIKMFVNGVETTFMKVGDNVTVQAEITDTGSGLDKVRLLARSIETTDGGYIDAGYFLNTTGDIYERSFVFPTDGKFIDTHKLVFTDLNALRFYIKAFDVDGNYTNSPSTTFTYDNIRPVVNVTTPVVDSYNNDPIEIGGTVTDQTSGVKSVALHIYEVIGGSTSLVAGCTTIPANISGSDWSLSVNNGTSCNLGDGYYEIAAWGYDNVNNPGWAPRSRFYVDNTAPATPTDLKRLGLDGNEYSCSDYSLRQNMVPDWGDNTEPDFDHYEYSSFNANGNQGLDERVFYDSIFPNTWVAPVDGTYGYAVRAVDMAGNKSEWALTDETWADSCQINYDNTAPSTPEVLGFLSPDLNCGSITNVHNTTVDWTDAVDLGIGFDHYEYNIDYPKPNGSRGNWTTTLTSSQYSGSLNEGRHDIRVRGVDSLGNTSDWSNTCSITTDWTLPVTTLTSPVAGDITNQDILIEGSSTDLGKVDYVNLYYRVSGDTNWTLITSVDNASDDEPFSFSHSWLPSSNETYDIKAAGVDTAGNEENSWIVLGVTYDTVAPVNPSLVEPTNNAVVNGATLLSDWTTVADADYYIYESYHNAAANILRWHGEYTDSYKTASNVANSTFWWKVKAVDAAGNESEWSSLWKITIDNDAPDVEVTTPTAGLVSGTVDIRGTVTDDNPHHYWFVIQNSGGTTVAGPGVVNNTNSFVDELLLNWDTTTVSDGVYTIKLEARDSANNKDSGSSSWVEVTVDNTVNKPVITAPVTGAIFNTFTIRAEWDEVLDASGIDKYEIQYDYLVNGVPTTAYREVSGSQLYRDQSLSGNVQGDFTIMLRAYDNFGNVSDWSDSVTYNFDSIKPTSTITTFELDDDGSVETASFSGLIEGTSIDEDVTLSSGVTEVLLEIMHTPFGATESSYWNGTDWQNSTTTVLTTGTDTWSYQIEPVEQVLEGTYVVKSHALDNAGNMEETYTITIVYDKTIPEVELTIDPTSPDGRNSWYITEPTVTLTASDNYSLDHIEYQWNSSTGTWSTYSTALTPPSEGQNILYYRSIDTVGNVSDIGVKEVKYDKVAPTDGAGDLRVKNIKSETADASWSEPANDDEIVRFVLEWKHEDGTTRGTSVDGDTYNTELFDLFDGEWELTLRSEDAAGNSYSVTEKFTVGGSSSSVLGATTDTTGIGGATGFVAGVNTESSATTEESEETSETDEEKEGSVAGATDESCSGLKFYLPIILLLLQAMFLISMEIANREASSKKAMMAVGLSILTIGLFFIFRDASCYSDGHWMSFVNKWFIAFSLGLAVLIRFAASISVEEK